MTGNGRLGIDQSGAKLGTLHVSTRKCPPLGSAL